MAVDLKCDGSGGGEHATKQKTSLPASSEREARMSNVPTQSATMQPNFEHFSQSAIDPVCNLLRKYEEFRIDKPPPLPTESVVWVVRVFIYVRTQRTVRNNRHTRLFRTLSNLRGYHFHGRLCTMNACPLFPLSAGSLALSTACL